ncbi:hypothetical protein [Kitasatospora sp. GP82]|uniref:hypothetical protein n=1 Tax=Kitasatospora sp. GP82 TaxID=3035089 RepID=UPI00247381F7|nr:hypothetical protein [Kitasatospora sp. GP82]MDH6126576.1 hypothetical protein [Kitasatospora sp. GP82]
MPDRHSPVSGQSGQRIQSGPSEPAVPGPGTPVRRLRPAQLLFEPQAGEPEPERFFDLESIDDPAELLRRSTELTLAFRAAAERATDFQAIAAAQLADTRRFDALSPAEIAERVEWTPDYAARMVDYGRTLLRQQAVGEH